MYELRAKTKTETDVLMYGSISEWGRVRAEDFISKLGDAKAKGYSRVNLKINSPGGSIVEGIAIMSQMGREDLYICGTVEGIAASMASVMLQGCDWRRMVKGARMMAHQGSGGVFGTANYIREYADLLESYNKTLAEIYAKRSKKRDAKWILDNWMAEGKDTWFTAEQALKEGLIDEIVEGVVKPLEKENATLHEMAAHYDQFFTDTNDTMNKTELIALLGLKAEATDAEIQAALKAMKAKADTAPATPPAAATTNTEKVEPVTSAIVALAKERGADDATIEAIKKVAAINAEAAVLMIPKAAASAATGEKKEDRKEQEKPLNLNDLIAAIKGGNGTAAEADRKSWSYDDWSQKDQAGLLAMARTKPADFAALFEKQHGYKPSEEEIKKLAA